MARISSQRRLLRALALPFLAAIGLSTLGCGSSHEDDGGAKLGNVKQLTYAVRQYVEYADDGTAHINVADGMDQMLDYNRYVPGGRLEIYDLANKTAEN